MNVDFVVGVLRYFVFELLVPLSFVLGFLVFIWGCFLYVIAGGFDEESREKAKALMLYGCIVFIIGIIFYFLLAYVFTLVGAM